MNEQMIKLLEQLASKLGTTAEMLWEVLLKQAFIYSIWQIITIVFLGLLAITAGLTGKHFIKLNGSSDDYCPVIVISFIVCVLCSVLAVMLLADNGQYIIAGFCNPEYWAFNKLCSMLKGMNE